MKLDHATLERIAELARLDAGTPEQREATALPGLPKEQVLANSPVPDSDYFKVPRVLAKG